MKEVEMCTLLLVQGRHIMRDAKVELYFQYDRMINLELEEAMKRQRYEEVDRLSPQSRTKTMVVNC